MALCRLCSHGYSHLGRCPADPMLWWVVPPSGRHHLHHLVRSFERPADAIGDGSWTADGGQENAIEADIAALAVTDNPRWVERVLAVANLLSCGRSLHEALCAAALAARDRLTEAGS